VLELVTVSVEHSMVLLLRQHQQRQEQLVDAVEQEEDWVAPVEPDVEQRRRLVRRPVSQPLEAVHRQLPSPPHVVGSIHSFHETPCD
jgi:hypothetical protein